MPLFEYKPASRSISARPRRPTTTPDSPLINRVHHKYSAANRCVTRTLTMHQGFPSSRNSQHISNKPFVLLVPGGGVEPPRPCGRRILSPLRLPVPPSRRISILSALEAVSYTPHTVDHCK